MKYFGVDRLKKIPDGTVKTFMSTKPKPKRMSDAQVRALELAHFKRAKRSGLLLSPDGHPLRPEAGIQISLRLPRTIVAKLTRLARAQVQSKSQYITKLVTEIQEAA